MAAIKHNGLSHQGSCSNSSNGSNNGSVMSDCHVTADGDSSPGFEWVGASCGHHGTYTFYKAVKLSTSMHRRVLALGDFFFVKMWTDQEIVSIGELQLLWEDDKFPVHNNGHHHHNQPSSSPLASLKLYFLPENTPDGRHEEHGEDEVVSISEKVVLKISDLATWLVDDVKWEKGAPSVWERQCPTPPPSPPDSPDAADATEGAAIPPTGANIGVLDMRDVIKEKQSIGDATGSSNVLVLSYPAYCRYRSTLKRLEGHNQTDYMRQAVVEAIGGRAAPCPNTRVVFCKDTFDYPELEDHELLCNHLAPKWKGRPRKMLKKRSHSPGSESNESESSVSTVTSSYRSKDSPMKPGIRNVPTPYRAGDRPKGEQVFMQKLHKFMAGQGTPIGRLPSLGFKQLDLFLFYTKVQRAGGYEAAVANKQWKGIYIELGGHPSNTSAATCTRRHYEKLLLPYERYATSLAVEESTTASTSVATPPKKRKISDVSDLPFELAAAPVEHVEDEEDKNLPTPSNGGGGTDAGRMDRLRIVESCLPQSAEESSKSPKIVESSLPGSVIVRHPQPPPPLVSSEAPDDGVHSEPEIMILSHPPTTSQPIAKVAVRSDLTHPVDGEVPVEMKEQLKAAAESSSLNLAGLMAAGDRANLLAAVAAAAASGDSKQLSALGDFARYAQQLDATSGSAAKLNRNKESKNHAGSGEVSKDGDIRRPSVIQKNSVDGRTSKSGQQSSGSSSAQPTELGSPPPAHSQKPVTLPSIPAGEVPASEQLRQWYAQMLSDKATGGNPLPASAAAMLELTLRPPAPAAATPSIFVPSRRIYVDPNLDIKKNRNSTALAAGSSSAIPAAHSKLAIQSSNKMSPTPINTGPPPLQNITPPRPAASRPVAAQTNHVRGSTAPQSLAPAARPAAIPLVDLTSRSINNMKAEDHHSSRKASQPFGAHPSSQMEMNGKPLLDLSAHQQNKLPGLPKWNSSPRSGDVSISLNVKIDGVGSDAKTSSGASSSNAQQRHSVSVVPLVKEEMSNSRQHRKEKEMMRMDRVSVTPQQQQQQQHQHQQQQQLLQQPQAQPQAQPQSYPRMVDSLVTMNASSSGASSVTKSGPIMASSHYGGSSSSGSSKPTTSSSSAGLHAGYPALLDPALASYYSSFYSSHMYNLPAGAFMAAAAAAAPPQLQHTPTSSAMFHHHHHQQMMQSSAAAEVTAQVYKDMIQRGYPPALAPVLPPGLSGLPGLSSLGSFAASMYSPMGGGKDSTPAERSLPKS